MKLQDKMAAISLICPGAEYIITEEKISWLDKKQTQPTDEEIEKAWVDYQAKITEDESIAQAKKATAVAKLVALGLTTEDLKALGLN